MIDTKQFIHKNASLVDALKKLNALGSNALTLLVVDADNKIVGTVTDGYIRRHLISCQDLSVEVDKIARKAFTYLKVDTYDVRQLHTAKEKGIELLPVVDDEMRVVDVVNLTKQKSYLPIDAVLMAGGKG